MLFTIISHNVNQNGPHQGSATCNGHVMGHMFPYIPYFITVKLPFQDPKLEVVPTIYVWPIF